VLTTLSSTGFFDGAAGDCSDVNLLPTLARGWAFVSLEYRLVPQVTLPDLIADIKDASEFITSGALDKALGGGKVDGSRYGISGASAGESRALFFVARRKGMTKLTLILNRRAGGSLALLAGYTLSPPPRVVYALYPASNITHPSYTAPVAFPSGTIAHSEISHFLDPSGPIVSHSPANVDFSTMIAKDRTRACFWAVQEGKVSELATRTTDADELKKFVAKMWVVEGKTPPTVVVHGTADAMVPFETSEELVNVLSEKGVECELIKAEGENHGFDLAPGLVGDEEKMKVFEQANDFVARFLG
jgi:acetyl esterase/lipase